MKNDKEMDDVGAVEGGHVEHEDDLHSLDVDHSQDVGQGPQKASHQGKCRAENGEYLAASNEYIVYLCFHLEEIHNLILIYKVLLLSLLFFFPLELICYNF